jgi:hypothetical protein
MKNYKHQNPNLKQIPVSHPPQADRIIRFFWDCANGIVTGGSVC